MFRYVQGVGFGSTKGIRGKAAMQALCEAVDEVRRKLPTEIPSVPTGTAEYLGIWAQIKEARGILEGSIGSQLKLCELCEQPGGPDMREMLLKLMNEQDAERCSMIYALELLAQYENERIIVALGSKPVCCSVWAPAASAASDAGSGRQRAGSSGPNERAERVEDQRRGSLTGHYRPPAQPAMSSLDTLFQCACDIGNGTYEQCPNVTSEALGGRWCRSRKKQQHFFCGSCWLIWEQQGNAQSG